MTDLFTRLAKRTLGLMPVVQPRIASRFVPEEAMASEKANLEIPSLFESDRSLVPRGEAETQENRDAGTWRLEISSHNPEKAISPPEEVSPARVELRKENSSAVDPIRHRETQVANKKEVTQLGKNEQRDSPTQEVLTPAAREREWESSNSRDGEKQIASETDSSKKNDHFHNPEKAITSPEEVSPARVELRKENSSAVDPIRHRETQVANKKEVTQLGKNEQRDSPTQEVLTPAAREREWESSNSRDGEKQIASETDSSKKNDHFHNPEKAITSPEEVSPARVELRKENSSAVDPIRHRETQVANKKEVTQLGKNEQRDSPIPEVLTQAARGMEQKASSQEWESRENESGFRESEASANPDQLSGKTPPTTVTADIFSTNQEQARGNTPFAPVTEEKVDSRKVNSLEVNRGIESESLLKSRGGKEPDFKASAEELSTINTSIELSSQAIALQTIGKVQSGKKLTAPEFPKGESETNLPLQEQEKPRALKGIEEQEKFLPRREELNKSVPETVNQLAEQKIKKGESEKQKTVKLAGVDLTRGQIPESLIKLENNALQLYESKLAEERKTSITSTPTIQVTIGKIEVRGTKPAVKPVEQSRRGRSTVSSPKLSLDEYLKQRNR